MLYHSLVSWDVVHLKSSEAWKGKNCLIILSDWKYLTRFFWKSFQFYQMNVSVCEATAGTQRRTRCTGSPTSPGGAPLSPPSTRLSCREPRPGEIILPHFLAPIWSTSMNMNHWISMPWLSRSSQCWTFCIFVLWLLSHIKRDFHSRLPNKWYRMSDCITERSAVTGLRFSWL